MTCLPRPARTRQYVEGAGRDPRPRCADRSGRSLFRGLRQRVLGLAAVLALAPGALAQVAAVPEVPSLETLWRLLGGAQGVALVVPEDARVHAVAMYRDEEVVRGEVDRAATPFVRVEGGVITVQTSHHGAGCEARPTVFLTFGTGSVESEGYRTSSGSNSCLVARDIIGVAPILRPNLFNRTQGGPPHVDVPADTWVAYHALRVVRHGRQGDPNDPADSLVFYFYVGSDPTTEPDAPRYESWEAIEEAAGTR